MEIVKLVLIGLSAFIKAYIITIAAILIIGLIIYSLI